MGFTELLWCQFNIMPLASACGIMSQTTCVGLHLIHDQNAWQEAHFLNHLLPWAFPRAARSNWKEQFDGCNLKLVVFSAGRGLLMNGIL